MYRCYLKNKVQIALCSLGVFISFFSFANTGNHTSMKILSVEEFLDILKAPEKEWDWLAKEDAVNRLSKDLANLDILSLYLSESLERAFHGAPTLSGKKWETYLNLAIKTNNFIKRLNSESPLRKRFVSPDFVGSLALYVCHGHSLMQMTTPEGDKITKGYYPVGNYFLYLPGEVKDERYYYTDEILETCQRLRVPLKQDQVEKVKDYVDTFEKDKCRYNAFCNNCIDFVQNSFECAYPDAGWFSFYMEDLRVYSYFDKFDRSAVASKYTGQGFLSALHSLTFEDVKNSNPIVTIWMGDHSQWKGRWEFGKAGKYFLDAFVSVFSSPK